LTSLSNINKPTKIRVLYIGLKYDYGKPELGFSYEYFNLYESLVRSEYYKVDFFPFDEIMREVGRDNMNKRLLETVQKLKPDCCFFVLFTDEIKKETIKTISEKSGSVTFNWFCDDHWRFNIFSKYWAPMFNWVSTTDSSAVDKYLKMGFKNIIKTQWGFNLFQYQKHDLFQDYDVTFIGQVHSSREKFVRELKKNNINIECWGKGWSNGRIDQAQMIKTYSRSKINLNFTESSLVPGWKSFAKVLISRRADNKLRINSPAQMIQNICVISTDRPAQIKARNFEIPGNGGFLLTQNADNLDEYFVPGKEITLFSDIVDLKDKIKYYLNHDEERENIRQAGFRRTLNDHTYEKRLYNIFQTMRLVQ
jgi:spore maturation protein CgeB